MSNYTGTTGNDSLKGQAGNDLLDGGAGNDTLVGGNGNDTLDGGTGSDTMDGGAGNDIYRIDSAGDRIINEILYGASTSTDTIETTYDFGATALQSAIENLTLKGAVVYGYGNGAANVIRGNAQNNLMDGGEGNDTLYGGDGNDQINGGTGTGADALYGDAGNDALSGGAGADTLKGGAGNDTLVGGTEVDTLDGEDGSDTYVIGTSDGMDNIVDSGLTGTDTVESAVTSSIAFMSSIEDLKLTGLGLISATGNAKANKLTGNDSANKLDGGAGNDTLIGGGGNDTLVGGLGNDTLQGGADNDLLDGGVGNDLLDGGAGDDVYQVDAGDTVTEAPGNGRDKIVTSVDMITRLAANVEDIELIGGGDITGVGNEQGNRINGNAAFNVLYGGAGNDTLSGGGGSDTLFGDEGDDVLRSSGTGDNLYGGAGNDTYQVDHANVTVAEVDLEGDEGGNDQVNASVTFTLADGLESLTLSGVAKIDGTGNAGDNTLTGNAKANTLHGGAGDDTLSGGGGGDKLYGDFGNDVLRSAGIGDSLYGGTGDDTYQVDHANVTAQEVGSYGDEGGNDQVIANVSFALADGIEVLTLSGAAPIDGTGNAQDNILTGNGQANRLLGAGGDDLINGGQGADTLLGGVGDDALFGDEGIDSMSGGIGDDTYQVDEIADVVTERPDEGHDTVYSTASDTTLGANVEALWLQGPTAKNGTGNDLGNVLYGNDLSNLLKGLGGDDELNGMEGQDTLEGGTGDDSYQVDDISDVVTELPEAGYDTVYSTASDTTLSPNVEALWLLSPTASNGTGNDLANVIYGGDGANRLKGLDGKDTLIGDLGADTLDGGAGDDALSGGEGADIYGLYGAFGNDLITDVDATAGVIDALDFGALDHTQLWFAKVGTALRVSVVGTSDQATILGWYDGSAKHIEEIYASDAGMVLDHSKVDVLVNAMALLTPPSNAATPPETSLAALINQTWTPA
jgi:Ca2+-binding RTX toxin-like protein